jgi:hypothetical protein
MDYDRVNGEAKKSILFYPHTYSVSVHSMMTTRYQNVEMRHLATRLSSCGKEYFISCLSAGYCLLFEGLQARGD